ncbi:MAG: NAD-dependent epimerase/dehydratase family protein [Cyanobacteriota bacterium]
MTGAGGALGRALLRSLLEAGADPVALRHGQAALSLELDDGSSQPIETVAWAVGEEEALAPVLAGLDVLVINHGINPLGARDAEALRRSLEVNTLSALRLFELMLALPPRPGRPREVWVNTSEAEVSPAFSPLYEISKRTLGELVSLRSLDADVGCTVRRLVLGPFRSELNPYGVMRAEGVARAVLHQAAAGRQLVIVTPNPLTWLLMPAVEAARQLYYRAVTRRRDP